MMKSIFYLSVFLCFAGCSRSASQAISVGPSPASVLTKDVSPVPPVAPVVPAGGSVTPAAPLPSGVVSSPVTGSVLATLSEEELNFLVQINALRAQNGDAPLAVDPILQQTARAHSIYMANLDFLTHDEPDPNLTSWDRIHNAGGDFNLTGENIACGNTDAAATYLQWLNSPEHLENMLLPTFQFIGIAVSGDYWTTDFSGYLPDSN
jgi:uncharacterized protein YkwD